MVAQHDTDRAGHDLTDQLVAGGVGLLDVVEDLAPQPRAGFALQQRHGHRPAGRGGDAAQDGELVVRLVEVGNDLHPALADLPQRAADGGKLDLGGVQRGRGDAGEGLVGDGAGGGEAERAGADALGGQAGHLVAVGLGGGFTVGAALAHHIDANGGVRHLGGDVEIVLAGIERIEELRESLPVPRQAGGQHHFGDVFHPFHQVHQDVALFRPARSEADAAIADQRCGDAVPGGGGDVVPPGDLRVVMGVHVDEAGGHELARGVDLPISPGWIAFRQIRADCHDFAIGDGDVGLVGFAAGTIDDGAAANDEGWGA